MKPTYLLLTLVPLALTHPTSPQPLKSPPGHNKLCQTIHTAITNLKSGEKTPESVWAEMAKAFAVIDGEHKCPAGSSNDDDNKNMSSNDCRVKALIESEIQMLLTMEKFEDLQDKMAEAYVRFGISLGCIHAVS